MGFDKGEGTRPGGASKTKGLLRHLWRGARTDERHLMLSLTCLPKEVLLDEVGYGIAQEEKPSRLYVPTALFVTLVAFRQDFWRLLWKSKTTLQVLDRDPEEMGVSLAFFCLELLCSMHPQGPRT